MTPRMGSGQQVASREGSFREKPPSLPRHFMRTGAGQAEYARQMYAWSMRRRKESMRRHKEKRLFAAYERELTPTERGYRKSRKARQQAGSGTGGFELIKHFGTAKIKRTKLKLCEFFTGLFF